MLQKALTAYVFLLLTCNVFGQTSDTLIIKTAINTRSGDSILYLKNTVGWKFMKECLTGKNLKGLTKATEQNSIQLSKAEYKYLHQQIKVLKDTEWPDSLFSKATSMADTNVWEYFARKKAELTLKQRTAKENHDTETLRKTQHEMNWVYGFSKPIYLRNDSVCLLYCQALCGNICGRNEAAFYKLENGTWVKWVVVGAGDY